MNAYGLDLPWSHGTVVTPLQTEAAMTTTDDGIAIERVQLGVRMEKTMVKVLKGLAEFEGVGLGQLLEKIVLHSFEAVPGEEGEMAASPHGKRALAAIADLKRIYGMDFDVHATRSFPPVDEPDDA
jgi:hypothetical protein